MLKTIRTKWYNGDYYLIIEEEDFFKLYINSIYRGETSNFLDYEKILPFKITDMSLEFINTFEFYKNL